MNPGADRHRHGFAVERVVHSDGTACWHVARFNGSPHARFTGEHYLSFDAALKAITPIVGELRGRFREAQLTEAPSHGR